MTGGAQDSGVVKWEFDPLDGSIFFRPDPLTKYVVAELQSSDDSYGHMIVDAVNATRATPAPAGWQEPKYLVWSNEHKAWWGPEHRGYTRIISAAGRYDRDEALAIAGTRGGGWVLNKGNPDEIAIPEQDAIDQYADITRAQAAQAEGGV